MHRSNSASQSRRDEAEAELDLTGMLGLASHDS